MVDKFYFTVCLVFLLLVCLLGGWQIGYDDAMKKVKRRASHLLTERDDRTKLWTVSVDGVVEYESLDDDQLLQVMQKFTR